ncbi:LysE family transporter [Paenibacillus sp. MZ04-78.2]|uniref:LysE family transporter n=1 Tax=Paenibacillus sp. MZ04-78.2 TaxID=2962034 RepID=UPI0020B7C81B|nr:LysE family transporter [Paenibacillus sp. MZ04-78.2]MCP3773305.1 LysE family transporter [Paenibacillus sp. MZ04-78.2]
MLILPFLSYIIATSFTPGPNNIMAMSNANKYGLRKTFRFIFGVTVGFFAIMLLSSFFNLVLYNYIPRIQIVMNLLGSLYMAYLAFKIMKVHKTQNKEQVTDTLNSFFTGFILQFINPKGILYGITAISTFVIPFYKSGLSLLLFSMLLAFVGFLSTFMWAVFGSLFQKFLSNYEQPFHIAMGLLLLYSAISIFL